MAVGELDYQRTTIVFPCNEDGFLLGMKKRGFGSGWWNGFGGKLQDNETYQESAQRETREEVGIQVSNLLHIANLHFYFNDNLGVVSRAYKATFEGTPQETEEMRPRIFPSDSLPFGDMWPADKLWLPEALGSKKLPLGFIVHFNGDKSLRAIDRIDAQELEARF